MEDLQYINTGCEDDAGIMTFLNDANNKKNWNIDVDKEWTPCNRKIVEEYQDSKNAYDVLPFLIKNNIRIVHISLFSGSSQEISTLTSLSSALKIGLNASGMS